MAMVRSGIGDRPKRREDVRFLTGRGAYLDDLAFDGLAHAIVLRSPHAHARIDGIDTQAAQAVPGVLAVLVAADARAEGLQPLRPTAEANVQTGEKFAFAPQPLLAADKVRYVGEPVALIVAETRAQALDAAELVAVEYAALPAVTTAAAARAPRAPQIAAEVPDNVCFDWLHRRHGEGRRRLCRGGSCGRAQPGQSPHRHKPDGAARSDRNLGRGTRPLYGVCFEPEHPRHPRQYGPCARGASGGG